MGIPFTTIKGLELTSSELIPLRLILVPAMGPPDVATKSAPGNLPAKEDPILSVPAFVICDAFTLLTVLTKERLLFDKPNAVTTTSFNEASDSFKLIV